MIDVYPVGALASFRSAWARIRNGHWRKTWTPIRADLGYLAYQVRRRNWRAVKNNFNGYLAEPHDLPDGFKRAGSGWTKARALRSLARHNPS